MIASPYLYPAPRRALAEFEGAAMWLPPARETLQVRGLLAYQFGPLHQVIPTSILTTTCSSGQPSAPPLAKHCMASSSPAGGHVVAQESEIMNPAPFMPPLGSQDYGTQERV